LLEEAERGKNPDDAESDSIDIECGGLRHNCVDSFDQVLHCHRVILAEVLSAETTEF